jgi:(p)ppGpp synthase/HD superfamily hydrolase
LKRLGVSRRPTPLFNKALKTAIRLHGDDRRKGSTRPPYVGHLIGVAAIVIDAGASYEVAAAALLHDSVEDHPDRMSFEKLRKGFSPRVARIVQECSDGQPAEARNKSTWLARKRAYIRHLPDCSSDGRLVSLADKLYNARACVLDLLAGADPWAGADVHAGRADQLGYYNALMRAFAKHPPAQGQSLVPEFRRTVTQMNELAARRVR